MEHLDTALAASSSQASEYPRRKLRRGDKIHLQATSGLCAWRVVSGYVRLDLMSPDEAMLAGLGLRGDIIGSEALISGKYEFEATALSDCELEAWFGPSASQPTAALQLLAHTTQRAAKVMALRSGLAASRIRRLISLLQQADDADTLPLPDQRAMAEITGLTHETVCRVMAQMRHGGELRREGQRRFSLRHEAAAIAC